ncbi:hypothetical protein HIM_05809 [Hirsutella minnesotensis 3608]|uniref:Fungal lipase-type domain-containing protein n=1 Tax=Hirsutella minnesotensis 3608 TaxID=1043627 RepID=A0A0F7ZZR7_9HYPO|nr:hypothetical protein HIM_05809 [Hirsutella minnesotensis 3608]
MFWTSTALSVASLQALCFVRLAFGDTTPASPDQIAQFVRYAKICTAVYQPNCKTPPEGIQVLESFKNAPTDTNGWIAKDPKSNEIIVAFRGSNTLKNFGTDLTFVPVEYKSIGVEGCQGCQVHKGFLDSWNSVADQVMGTVKKQMEENKGARLTVTGHSLGGAIASLATMSMIGSGMNVEVVTYGQPRTGNKAYADFVDSKAPEFRRVTHSNDGVPQIALNALGFQHHSTEFWQPDDKAESTVKCQGQEPKGIVSTTGLVINAAHVSYMGVQMANLPGAGVVCGEKDGLLSLNTVNTIGNFIGLPTIPQPKAVPPPKRRRFVQF